MLSGSLCCTLVLLHRVLSLDKVVMEVLSGVALAVCF